MSKQLHEGIAAIYDANAGHLPNLAFLNFPAEALPFERSTVNAVFAARFSILAPPRYNVRPAETGTLIPDIDGSSARNKTL